MGRLDGKVAVISGAARGQGRSHAVKLAAEGATIVGFDICEKLDYARTPGATTAELDETARLVRDRNQDCLIRKVDARDLTALQQLADDTLEAFGRIDILVVNHGVWTVARNSWELEEDQWQETIDHMLTGTWKVCKAFIPSIIVGKRGGAIVITASVNAIIPLPGSVAYCATKAGEIQMMRVLSRELGPQKIRVNAVTPGGVATPMTLEGGTAEHTIEFYPDYSFTRNALPVEMLSPETVSDAIVWLASDEAAFITGAVIPVDAGWSIA